MTVWRSWLVLLLVGATTMAAEPVKPKKIVVLAGKKSHGPEGNGIHDYPWSAKLIKVMLDNSNVKDHVAVEFHRDGWPADEKTLDDAAAIFVISDGRDGDLYEEAVHFSSDARAAYIERLIGRGVGFGVLHFSTFAPDKRAEQILRWSGGYFDWEEDGKKKWYSAIQTKDAEVSPVTKDHPALRGVGPFKLREEFYFNLRFNPDDKRLQPLLSVADLPGREPDGKWVAWAREREDGGRGFGTTCGHFYDNWQNESFRRFVLNALVWSAGVDVPAEGVAAKYYTHEQITTALAGKKGVERAVIDEKPIRVLLFAGNAAHKWHNWERTTPAIKELLEVDPRIKVDVSFDIEDLARRDLAKVDVIVQNYVNWHDPKGPSDAAKKSLLDFFDRGGGMVSVHFAASAFHFSLPMAGESDWPEYRKIVTRVWNHHGKGEAQSGHDAFGRFTVRPSDLVSEITAGLKPFEVEDELYFKQDGGEVRPLIVAKSKVTNRDEPLAWTSEYGRGRVFQTLLGHSEKTYHAFEACEMLRRGTAWAANRPIVPRTAPVVAVAEKPAEKPAEPKNMTPRDPLVDGKFGKAWDARVAGLLVEARPEQREPPLSVDLWVKMTGKGGFNIFVASEPKNSPTHWELYSYAGSGVLSLYMPGRGGEFKSDVNVCDGQWHHVGMALEPERLRLWVDGKQALDKPVKANKEKATASPLAFGRLVEGGIGCEGLLDELRISPGVRTFDEIPQERPTVDRSVNGVWRFDAFKDGKTNDDSALKTHATTAAIKAAPAGEAYDHYGQKVLGFKWTEQDSVDDRWQKTDIGPFLASVVGLPEGPVRKGLSIRVGDKRQATVCYDTEFATLRGWWTGDFLKFGPQRFGIIATPQPAGTLHYSRGEGAAWNKPVRHEALRPHGERVLLSYRVGETRVSESPWLESGDGLSVMTRTLRVEPSDEALELTVLQVKAADLARQQVKLVGDSALQLKSVVKDGVAKVTLELTPRKSAVTFKLLSAAVAAEKVADWEKLVAASPPPDLSGFSKPAPKRWPEAIAAPFVRGVDDGPFAVDTLTPPFENPYRALFFIGGHDFFANGDIAVVTVHGDVWRVGGVNDKLPTASWRRFATGLFQPLGVRVVNDQAYVLGRDQITRLIDENGDGEADRYENFSNLLHTSAGGHDYVCGLETDRKGNFYFVHATQGLVKISRDGAKLEVVATGLRNPNGIGMGPNDELTAAPQEGNWTPMSYVAEVKPGQHYGYGGPKVTPERPLGYDPPLCWIPRRRDNSSGGQVWIPPGAWGDLGGTLWHLSFGQCRAMLVLRETVAGRVQGGTVELPLPQFDSGIMRGRFNPRDNSLYLSGLRGWSSAATQDGCLQRVRRTDKPLDVPVVSESFANGLALTFTRPLDREAAEDVDNYSLEQWNYRYAADYGSKDYKVGEPKQEGRDEVRPVSATLLEDGRTVFLELPKLAPVMQLGIGYQLRAADGAAVKQAIYYTLNAIGAEAMPEAKLHRRARTGVLTEAEEARLRPGLLVRFTQPDADDTRVDRLAALVVGEKESVTPFLKPGAFHAKWEGFLKSPETQLVSFRADGGSAKLTINGKEIPADNAVELRKGFNRMEVDFSSPGAARLRLLWSADSFAEEPVPPTVLFHRGDDAQLAEADQLRRGREVFAAHHCDRCHVPTAVGNKPLALPEATEPPNFRRVARLNSDWLTRWLTNPQAVQPHAKMPRLFTGAGAEQDAADTAAFVRTLVHAAITPELELTAEEAEQGQILFEDLGCIACHRLTPPHEPDAANRRSLQRIGDKYSHANLFEFLRKPHADHAASGMPDFALEEHEARRLTAYLVNKPLAPRPAVPAGDAKRGKELFDAKGCNNCHRMGEHPLSDRARRNLGKQLVPRACLAENSPPGAAWPIPALDKADREAVLALLVTAPESLTRETPAESSRRLFNSLRCNACHDRDLARSPRGELILDEGDRGLAPENYPNLTWVGEKLHRPWTADFLAGKEPRKIRSWLHGRMPAFPAYANTIATGLAAEHGLSVVESDEFSPQADRAELGRKLMEATALDCRQCHGLGAEPPRADKETLLAPGVNFALVGARVRHDYFTRFLLDPPRFDVGSRMPKLTPDGRTTKVRDIHGGGAREQFESIWHFLRTPRKAP